MKPYKTVEIVYLDGDIKVINIPSIDSLKREIKKLEKNIEILKTS